MSGKPSPKKCAAIRCFAPAKINLFLCVTGVRSNGYHTLFSCFLPLTFGDELEFRFGEAPGVQLACSVPELASEDNLAVKAVKRYCEAFSLLPECRITLRKKIFCAAGLGGGSSDAAAALLACEKHYHRSSAARLKELALTLGADVPFFLNPRPALASGIGEELQMLKWPTPLYVLLLHPRFPVRTPDAYRHCRIVEAPVLPADWMTHPEQYAVNTLAEPLWKKFPLLGMLKEDLLLSGVGTVGISGSGPTLFALFRNPEQRTRSLNHMLRLYENAIHCVETEVLP